MIESLNSRMPLPSERPISGQPLRAEDEQDDDEQDDDQSQGRSDSGHAPSVARLADCRVRRRDRGLDSQLGRTRWLG